MNQETISCGSHAFFHSQQTKAAWFWLLAPSYFGFYSLGPSVPPVSSLSALRPLCPGVQGSQLLHITRTQGASLPIQAMASIQHHRCQRKHSPGQLWPLHPGSITCLASGLPLCTALLVWPNAALATLCHWEPGQRICTLELRARLSLTSAVPLFPLLGTHTLNFPLQRGFKNLPLQTPHQGTSHPGVLSTSSFP